MYANIYRPLLHAIIVYTLIRNLCSTQPLLIFENETPFLLILHLSRTPRPSTTPSLEGPSS